MLSFCMKAAYTKPPKVVTLVFGQFLTTSTVSHLSFVHVQWWQAFTTLPMVQAGEFVALESFFALVADAGGRGALARRVKDEGDAFPDLLMRDRRRGFFFRDASR
jgi:hypothetical protein